ncbi:MAG: MazG nucleotide pyrophosphohydrolase domain-containing protein [Candidatus Pacearchaeota archaeon]
MINDINEIQKRIAEFAEKRAKIKNFELNEEISLIHIMEELGELSSQIFNKKARPEKFNYKNLKEEVCDVILESMILSKLLNIDLSKELNNKIEELNKRKL